MIILLGIISGALFFGDAIITPALSVLSAIEGLKIVTPAFEPYIVPLTVVILVGLFAVQSRGTAKVAAFFGPITLVWFVALAIAGVWHIAQNPAVLSALNPLHGVNFLLGHGVIGLLTLGAVFLAVTGAEALYADLGHFGRGPIRFAWLTVVLPALTINNGSPERNRHFPCVPEHVCRLVGFCVKAHARRKIKREWPARRHEDADGRPSLGDLTGQVCSVYRTGHADVREQQPDVCVSFEKSQRRVGVSGFEHSVSRVREHIGRPHALQHVVVGNDNQGLGG